MNDSTTQQIIDLITKQNELISAQYAATLVVIGIAAAGLVLFLLYKFIKLFY